MILKFNPRQIVFWLVLFVIFLLVANVVVISFRIFGGHNSVYGLAPLFDLNEEQNIPTLFSTCLLLFSAFLLWTIALKHKLERSAFLPWLALALIFCFLAIDETAVIHERFTQPVRETLGTDGLLHYAWVIPYGLAVLAIAVLYLRFLFRLPKKFFILFIVAGAIYVCGAIGFEMLSGKHEVSYGRENLLYCTFYTLEELFEMTGIVLFIYGLLSYITEQFDGLSLNLKADKAET